MEAYFLFVQTLAGGNDSTTSIESTFRFILQRASKSDTVVDEMFRHARDITVQKFGLLNALAAQLRFCAEMERFLFASSVKK